MLKLLSYTENILEVFNYNSNSVQIIGHHTFNKEEGSHLMERTCFPVHCGYAITTWRAQGLTLEAI